MQAPPPNSDRVQPPVEAATRSTVFGRRAFIAGAAGAIVGAGLRDAVAHAVEPGASYFEAMSPRRLCDTRGAGFGFTRLDANTIRVQVGGNGAIPVDAVAAAFTLTGVDNRSGFSYVTAYPAGGGRPDTSNLNFNAGESTLANLVTVKLGTGALRGFIDVYTYTPCDILIDIAGVYRPTSQPVSAGRLVTIEPMVRMVDTRGGGKIAAGSSMTVDLKRIVPADAVAVVANLTAVDASGWGYLTAYELGRPAPPLASNLNVTQGDVRAAGVITKIGTSGAQRGIQIFTYSETHILLDVAGYITGPTSAASGDGLFVPIPPTRLLDTRRDGRRLWAGWTRSFELPVELRAKARAVSMNLTVVNAIAPGYFTVFAAQRERHHVSNLNVTKVGQTVANHVIPTASTEGVATWADKGAHVLADVTGWYTGGPLPIQYQPLADPLPPPVPLPWTMKVNRIGLGNGITVRGGDVDTIANRGEVAHWAGTGLVGHPENIAVFAHRTDAGGPFRYLHWLQPGDRLEVFTGDQRRYDYEYVTRKLTTSADADILAATRSLGGETFALIACTVGYDKTKPAYPDIWAPTSLKYRIVTIFRLLSWTDLG